MFPLKNTDFFWRSLLFLLSTMQMGRKLGPKKKKRRKDMGSECQPGNDQQLQRLSDRIRTAKNRGRERDGRSRFRNFVALTLGEGERQPKKRHRSPPCVSPGTNKNKLCSMTCGRVSANGTKKKQKNLCIKEGVPLHFEIIL